MAKPKKHPPIPLGLSDFKILRDKNYLYVDKSLFIQEILEKGTHAALFMRPRRFGKTLNLSMLYYFFAKTQTDYSYLFKDLLIWKEEECRALQGQFPVIFLSLKDAKYTSLEETLQEFRKIIAKEYSGHAYLLEGNILSSKEKDLYNRICNQDPERVLLEDSLLYLSEWLSRYHKKNVILLVDEYDAPIQKSYLNGFYPSFMDIFRIWMSKSFKDNRYVERIVLRGRPTITFRAV